MYLSKTFLFQAIQFSQTVLIQIIQFSISMKLVLFNPLIGPYQVLPFRARVDLGAMAMKGAPHSPKLQHHWNLTIRLFSVISRTLISELLPLSSGAVGVFYSPSRLSKRSWEIRKKETTKFEYYLSFNLMSFIYNPFYWKGVWSRDSSKFLPV